MPGLASRLAAERIAEVKIGGLHWRLRRVSTLDAAVCGAVSAIMALQPTDEHGEPTATADQALELVRNAAGIVCASVVEASEDGETWEALTLTIEDEDRPEASIVSYWSLPESMRRDLTAACSAHSGLAGEGQAVLDRFRP